MSKTITQYDLLISCPGDIQKEIELVEKSVLDFNERYSNTLGLSIRSRYWSKSSYPQSGGKPQTLLNKQFVKECDAAVAILWTRFGTPTDKYGSGTEEEIEIMLESGKQVFMYFSDKPCPPSKHDPIEYAKVQAFKQKYKDRGYYFTYTSEDEFSKLFSAHLTQYFITIKKVEELRQERISQLSLRGIDANGRLCDSVPIQLFKLNTECNHEQYIMQIKQLYHSISKLHVMQQSNDTSDEDDGSLLLSNIMTSFYPPVVIDERRKDILIKVAMKFGLELPEDFFNLGNLTEDILQGFTDPGKYSLEGTPEEKQKYALLNTLYTTIINCSRWTPIEKAFSGIKCVKLAIENSGTAIDEDVEITITIAKEMLLPLKEFPSLNRSSTNYLMNDCVMETIFGIPNTAQYMEYRSSVRPRLDASTTLQNMPISSLNLYSEDDGDSYEDALRNVFCYSIYSDEQNYILKLRFDYIKHHTAVAFPTVIFLKSTPSVITYTISSRNSADVINGSIDINDTVNNHF